MNDQNNNSNPTDLSEYTEITTQKPQQPINTNKASFGKRFLIETFEWLETFCYALTLMVLIFLFAFKLVSVDGESMRETLQHMDSLVISELSNNYVTGDVIVVRSPSHTNPLVKRVIATEGQTVEIDFENWIIKVDGVVLDEPYITGMREHRNMKGYEYYNGKFTVQEGKIYVMGDNRNNSTDSRDPTVGQLDQRSILGKVVLRVFPLDKFGKIK